MKNSYACIKRVEPMRRSRMHSVRRLEPVRQEHGSSQSREDSRCGIPAYSISFMAALLLAAATIDAAPVIAVIALGVMAWAVNQINKEERNGR